MKYSYMMPVRLTNEAYTNCAGMLLRKPFHARAQSEAPSLSTTAIQCDSLASLTDEPLTQPPTGINSAQPSAKSYAVKARFSYKPLRVHNTIITFDPIQLSRCEESNTAQENTAKVMKFKPEGKNESVRIKGRGYIENFKQSTGLACKNFLKSHLKIFEISPHVLQQSKNRLEFKAQRPLRSLKSLSLSKAKARSRPSSRQTSSINLYN